MEEIERLRIDNHHLMEQVKELQSYKGELIAAKNQIYKLEHRLGQKVVAKLKEEAGK